jgi:hypothetical protein
MAWLDLSADFPLESTARMGRIKGKAQRIWNNRGTRTHDSLSPLKMRRSAQSVVESRPKFRYTSDGFWTTQQPAAKAFSIEWFKIHISVLPYCWTMFQMAWSVSQAAVLTIGLGTIARALLDVASIYAYMRFVSEVRQIS